MNYFAYGANLSSAVLKRRGLVPSSIRRARLPGYRLAFSDVGIPFVEPAFATVEEDSTAEVHGVVYTLGEDAMEALDAYEGKDNERMKVRLQFEDQTSADGFTYRSRVRRDGLRPSRRYLSVVVAGATERELDPAYIAQLRAHPSAYVPILSEVVAASVGFMDWLNRKTGFFDRIFH